MGGLAMGECEDKQRNSCNTKQNVNILKEYMEDCHQVMFTHAMDFFKNVQA